MTALILDDDETYQYIMQTLLSIQAEQIEFKQLTNPVEALEFLKTDEGKKFDTVFLDINMPYINGWEFLHEMEQAAIHKNVFILTSSADISDLEKSRLYSVIKGYYVKPLKAEQLTAILKFK